MFEYLNFSFDLVFCLFFPLSPVTVGTKGEKGNAEDEEGNQRDDTHFWG